MAGRLRYLAATLPATIGNSDGTYIVTLRIKGLNNNGLDIHEPILAIQWTTQRTFLFFDNAVNEVSKTEWNGTVVDQMLLGDTNRKLQFSAEISFHKNRSLDFAFLRQASKSGNASSLISLLPLPAAASPLIDSVTALINNIYSNSTIDDVVNAEEVEVTVPSTRTAKLPVQAQGTIYNIPIYLNVTVTPSRLVEGGLVNGKFDKNKISQTLFDMAQVSLGKDKSVSLAELITTASDQKSKKTRSFLDSIQNGDPYTKDDLSIRCGDLATALDVYLSKADARAMLWAFMQRYSAQVNRDKCLGSGTLSSELASLGLSF
jgi:hypothetical protein